jgi:hypothetical protein
MKTRLEGDGQQMAQCVDSIPYECGRNCTGETGRLQVIWVHEHRHDLKEKKLKLVKHAYEDGHRVSWDEARILKIENKSSCRKYKDCLPDSSL